MRKCTLLRFFRGNRAKNENVSQKIIFCKKSGFRTRKKQLVHVFLFHFPGGMNIAVQCDIYAGMSENFARLFSSKFISTHCVANVWRSAWKLRDRIPHSFVYLKKRYCITRGSTNLSVLPVRKKASFSLHENFRTI